MTKHSSEALRICRNISNQTYQKAIQRLTEWTESAYSVNVYLEEEGNYFIPTPIDEIEELDEPECPDFTWQTDIEDVCTNLENHAEKPE